MFQTQVAEKIKTRILCSIIFFSRKLCSLWDNVEKHGKAEQATYDNIMRSMRFAWWITRIHTHTHTHRESIILIGFARQQWLCERAWVLRYTYRQVLLTSSLLEDEYPASRPSRFTFRESASLFPLNRMQVGLQSLSERFGENIHILRLSEIVPRFFGFPSRSVVCVTTTPFWLPERE